MEKDYICPYAAQGTCKQYRQFTKSEPINAGYYGNKVIYLMRGGDGANTLRINCAAVNGEGNRCELLKSMNKDPEKQVIDSLEKRFDGDWREKAEVLAKDMLKNWKRIEAGQSSLDEPKNSTTQAEIRETFKNTILD